MRLATHPLGLFDQSNLVNSVKKSFDSRFFNREGKIRLGRVRVALGNDWIDHAELLAVYDQWVKQDEYMLFCKELEDFRHVYKAVKCSKRGNDVYQWRIEKRFAELDGLAEQLGNDKIFGIGDYKPQTNVLFMTFSYNRKRKSESRAWDDVGKEFDECTRKIRDRFGKISVLRAWESYKSGYPHVHAVVIFHEAQFDVFEHANSENKTTYRIQQKDEFESMWHGGESFVDIMAVSSLGGAVRYITKYLRKTHGYDSSRNLTQAMMWLHRKRSFSMSDDFVERCRLVSQIMHNSRIKSPKMDLFGNMIEEKWRLIGIFPKNQLMRVESLQQGLQKNQWVVCATNINNLCLSDREVEI